MTMEIDLYKDDLAAFGDQELYAAVEAFTGVAQPATDRTQEGYLLDFKESWNDSAFASAARTAGAEISVRPPTAAEAAAVALSFKN